MTCPNKSLLTVKIAPDVTLSGHSDVIYGIQFLPDGRSLISASGDKTLRIWDICEPGWHDTFVACRYRRGSQGDSVVENDRETATCGFRRSVVHVGWCWWYDGGLEGQRHDNVVQTNARLADDGGRGR